MATVDYTSYQEGTPPEALYDKPLLAYVQNNANNGVRLELIKFNGKQKSFELWYPRQEHGLNFTEIENWGSVYKWLPALELSPNELPKPDLDPF